MHRILIVDDNQAIREALVDALGDEGYVVEAVPDGHAALAAVLGARPSVVLLDLMMPDLDGATVAQRLSAQGCDAPIIVVTADRAGSAKAREIGAAAVLTKPFDLGELIELIERFAMRPVSAASGG